MLAFEWDERKNRQNHAKHGIWFEEARTVFDDPQGRFLLLGFSAFARMLVVVHCYRKEGDAIRIIPARGATKKETRDYEKRI
jgi:uncharacterized DUF497 family protein